MSSSLPLQAPPTSHKWPPSSSSSSSPSLPAHYPCHTGPGPTWHSLVDLIELDIPACLGIVRWHENLPAIPWKQEKREASATLVRRSEGWRFSGMEELLPNEESPISHCHLAQCQVPSGTRSGVSLHLTPRCGKILTSNNLLGKLLVTT